MKTLTFLMIITILLFLITFKSYKKEYNGEVLKIDNKGIVRVLTNINKIDTILMIPSNQKMLEGQMVKISCNLFNNYKIN